jgi:regulator of sirC expression with transglutaminase-like and TPR domain
MRSRINLTLFAHVVARPDAELDLAEAALLIAEGEYPALDVARYLGVLDDLGRRAAERAQATAPEARIEQIVRWLYGEAGFRGNDGDYYDPRNSFLNDVLDRKTGIPITLALVLTEVCRRAGIEARGVSFPGHFLVRSEVSRGTIIIDPFHGRLLGREEVRALHARGGADESGGPDRDQRDPPARLLEPATKPQILLRMLNNLRGIYESRSDAAKLRGVLERMHVLAPSDDLRERIARLGGTEPWRPSGRGVN